ncbi:MAG TPA: rhodanese-like domain-containing protein [Chryseosolibacter sp.]|nr:rhodanese-like domain-containing protein [Chryseosolibacter sp.]
MRKDQQVVIHCQSGDRATIGYSLLAKHGFKNVKNYSGGMNEWNNAGNEVVKEN